MSQRASFFASSAVPFRLVFLMWLFFSVQFYTGIDLGVLGIRPRTFGGLIGIFLAPLIHGDYMHLLSNTFPVLFLGIILYFFYDRIAGTVFFRSYFITNLMVWLFAFRDSYHIGASGLVYALTSFLILFGFLRRDFLSLLIATGILILYGGVFISGVLPVDPRISWESHLSGALVGAVTAINLASQRKIR